LLEENPNVGLLRKMSPKLDKMEMLCEKVLDDLLINLDYLTKTHFSFKASHHLEDGLDKTLEHEFTNLKKDVILFYSE
jgi:hypothetical protein